MRSNMKRGLVAAVTLSAAAALALGGCGSSKTGSGGGGGAITLKLVAADYGTGPQNSSQKYWQGIADAFHKQNPNITVTVQTINWNDFDSQVKTMVQNKQYPDVLEGDYFPDYAQAGLLYPAKDVTSPATFSNLLPVFAKLDTYNGTQYGMPFTTSARTLFYNKKLFQQAGITAPPQTWADIQTDAAKIKRLGKMGFGLPLGPEEAQAESLLWFLGDGGGYQDAGGNWVINSAPNATALQFMAGLVKAGDTEPNPGTKNRTDLWKQFAQGQIGMMQAWLQEWNLSPTGSQPPMAWMPDGAAAVRNGLMPGMATPAELEQLRQATGLDEDRLFLRLMIQHHLGGIHMSQAVLGTSKEKEVTEAAQLAINNQQRELTDMQALEKSLGAKP